MKRKMVDAIKGLETVAKSSKRVALNQKELLFWVQRDIHEFVTPLSLFLFDQFNASYEFLDVDPELWPSDRSFQEAAKIFKNLKVVNDIAERAVALIADYNDVLTKDEDQKQCLLQVVQKHRKDYPECNKKNLTKK